MLLLPCGPFDLSRPTGRRWSSQFLWCVSRSRLVRGFSESEVRDAVDLFLLKFNSDWLAFWWTIELMRHFSGLKGI